MCTGVLRCHSRGGQCHCRSLQHAPVVLVRAAHVALGHPRHVRRHPCGTVEVHGPEAHAHEVLALARGRRLGVVHRLHAAGTPRSSGRGRLRSRRCADRCAGWRPRAAAPARPTPTAAATGTAGRPRRADSMRWCRYAAGRSRRPVPRPPAPRSRDARGTCPRPGAGQSVRTEAIALHDLADLGEIGLLVHRRDEAFQPLAVIAVAEVAQSGLLARVPASSSSASSVTGRTAGSPRAGAPSITAARSFGRDAPRAGRQRGRDVGRTARRASSAPARSRCARSAG